MIDSNEQTKKKQRTIIIIVVVVLFLLMIAGAWLFDPGSKAPPAKPKLKPTSIVQTGGANVDDKEMWRYQAGAQLKSVTDRLGAVENRNKALEEQLEKERAARDKKQERPSSSGEGEDGLLNEPLPMSSVKPGAMRDTPASNSVQSTSVATSAPAAAPAPPPRSLDTTSVPAKKPVVDESKNVVKDQTSLPGTSFVRVAMLNGVDAPTGGQSDPAPIAFHALDPANLASLYQLDITDCRFLGAATGEIQSERTKVRLASMTCILGSGKTIEVPIAGHAIGEDGRVGIRGRVVEKQGQMLANALLSGIASGIGTAFQQSASTITTSPLGSTSTLDSDRVGRAAIGGGVSSGANALASYYMRQAEKLYPVIETDGGRIVELLITKSATFGGAKDSDAGEYRQLLKRNNSERSFTDD